MLQYTAVFPKLKIARKIRLSVQSKKFFFQCVRQILSERETHLLAELRRVQDEGARFLNERRVLSCELAERASRMGAMSDREQEELRAELECFEAEKLAEEEMGRTTRFLCDNSQLIRLIKNFGEGYFLNSFLRRTPLRLYLYSATGTTFSAENCPFAFKRFLHTVVL